MLRQAGAFTVTSPRSLGMGRFRPPPCETVGSLLSKFLSGIRVGDPTARKHDSHALVMVFEPLPTNWLAYRDGSAHALIKQRIVVHRNTLKAEPPCQIGCLPSLIQFHKMRKRLVKAVSACDADTRFAGCDGEVVTLLPSAFCDQIVSEVVEDRASITLSTRTQLPHCRLKRIRFYNPRTFGGIIKSHCKRAT